MCIDIVEIWFGIDNGLIIIMDENLLTFDRVICPPHDNGWVLSFQVFSLPDC